MIDEQNGIPPKNRPEWRDIVTGKTDHYFSNYVLRMKSHKFATKIRDGEMTIEEAVDDVYELARKYSRSVERDFVEIFKTW